MYQKILYRIVVLTLFSALVINAVAQDEAVGATTELLAKVNNENGKISVFSGLKYENANGDLVPLSGETIEFYSLINPTAEKIGTIKTNAEGIAVLDISNRVNSLKNDTGLMLFKVLFSGSEKYISAEADCKGMEIRINMSFDRRTDPDDSTKTLKIITANAHYVGKNNEQIPLSGFDLSFFTPSLFGLLPIGTGFLEEGVCEMKFPKKLPGDSAGNIVVFVKILENETYGDVSFSANCNLAKKHSGYKAPSGVLWSTDPPLWMVITLFILIFGVWSHYTYIFIKMKKIHSLGKVKK